MTYFCQLVLYFAIYSFLGWVCECVYCSIPAGKFINRGFLAGPVCPVYGFGALAVITALTPVQHNLVVLFFCGETVTTVLEYLTSVLLEKLFHMKWWDYSHYRFHINGRVCLLNSLLFGLLSVVVMRLVHPPVMGLVEGWEPLTQGVLAGIVIGLFVSDTIVSVRATLQLSGKMEQLHLAMEELKEKSESYVEQFQQNLEARRLERIPDPAAREEKRAETERRRLAAAQYVEQLRTRVKELANGNKVLHRRLIDAFPSLRSDRYEDVMERVRESIRDRREKRKSEKENR